ncbi:hypothetical protein K7432_009282 [Basidiobolus ranarum]|uniref:Uncharacterized protein n=1 Tax=Basidiobolus ranarum TaxID=34480 RepID=A0ABR2WQH0_9FUNG
MIDIRDPSEKIQDTLNTSKKIPTRNRSSNGRFKSTKKRTSNMNQQATCTKSNESISNNDNTLEVTIISEKKDRNSRRRQLKRGQSEKSPGSDTSDIYSTSYRRNTRMSRRSGSDTSHVSEDPSKNGTLPETPSVSSSDNNKNVTNSRKRRRRIEENNLLSNSEIPTDTLPSNNGIIGPEYSPTIENSKKRSSKTSSSSERTVDTKISLNHTRCSSTFSVKKEKKASDKKKIARIQVKYIYLPKEDHYSAIQRLEALRDEYKQLSAQVESWHGEIRRFTEPEELKDPIEEEEEEEIIPLIVQRPQRNRRKPKRTLYDV